MDSASHPLKARCAANSGEKPPGSFRGTRVTLLCQGGGPGGCSRGNPHLSHLRGCGPVCGDPYRPGEGWIPGCRKRLVVQRFIPGVFPHDKTGKIQALMEKRRLWPWWAMAWRRPRPDGVGCGVAIGAGTDVANPPG